MKRDSTTERAVRRRIALLSLLHTQPRPYQAIVEYLTEQDLLDYDRFASPTDIAVRQKAQFKRDLKAWKASGFIIEWQRQTNCYVWTNSPFKLSLNSSQLRAFSLLWETFEKTQILHSGEIQDLLLHLKNLLPVEQQKFLDGPHQSYSINLRETTDYRQADPTTVEKIERAIRQGQRLEFLYVSPRDGKERHHLIESQPLVFERGHVTFKGWSIPWQKWLPFRLDHVVAGSAQVLPDLVERVRPGGPTYQLVYWLSPIIARLGVSGHFKGQQVTAHPDGSATVSAPITDLFEARRLLLGYGQNCRVLEPPELVEQFRQVAEALYQTYANNTSVVGSQTEPSLLN
jgi:predicted DNA-binding transcriptional regulator YafY